MKCLAKLARGRINIVNDGVNSLQVSSACSHTCMVFELGQEFFECVSSSRESMVPTFDRGDGIAAGPVRGAYWLSLSE
jgi:hypothetical protein